MGSKQTRPHQAGFPVSQVRSIIYLRSSYGDAYVLVPPHPIFGDLNPCDVSRANRISVAVESHEIHCVGKDDAKRKGIEDARVRKACAGTKYKNGGSVPLRRRVCLGKSKIEWIELNSPLGGLSVYVLLCSLSAQGRHEPVHRTCPLSGVKRTRPLREFAFAVAIGSKADIPCCNGKCLLTQSCPLTRRGAISRNRFP